MQRPEPAEGCRGVGRGGGEVRAPAEGTPEGKRGDQALRTAVIHFVIFPFPTCTLKSVFTRRDTPRLAQDSMSKALSLSLETHA